MPARTGGEVAEHASGADREARAVEQHEVGGGAGADLAAVPQPDGRGRHRGQAPHGLLEGELVVDVLGEHAGRVVGAAEGVDVRAAVARARHGQRVAEQEADDVTVLLADRSVDDEHRLEVLAQRELEEGVERVRARLAGEVADWCARRPSRWPSSRTLATRSSPQPNAS